MSSSPTAPTSTTASSTSSPSPLVEEVALPSTPLVEEVAQRPSRNQVPSDYTGQQIYYRSLQQRETDLLTTYDYLWRWDTDWFWCSRAFGAQHPLVRRLWPRRLRRSDTYHRMVGLERRFGIMDRLDRRAGLAAVSPHGMIVTRSPGAAAGTAPGADAPPARQTAAIDNRTAAAPLMICPVSYPRR